MINYWSTKRPCLWKKVDDRPALAQYSFLEADASDQQDGQGLRSGYKMQNRFQMWATAELRCSVPGHHFVHQSLPHVHDHFVKRRPPAVRLHRQHICRSLRHLGNTELMCSSICDDAHDTAHYILNNGSNLCLTTEAAACNSFWVPLQVSVEKETHGLWSTVAWPDIPPLSAGLSTIHQVYYGNLIWTIEHEIKRCCTLKGSHLWKMLHDDAIEELGAS